MPSDPGQIQHRVRPRSPDARARPGRQDCGAFVIGSCVDTVPSPSKAPSCAEVAVLLGATTLLSGVLVWLPIESSATTSINDSFAISTSVIRRRRVQWHHAADQPFPCLTATPGAVGGTIPNCGTDVDPDGSGWLMFTDAGGGEASDIIYNGSFPSADGLDITFDVQMTGGSGADGLSFDLASAAPGAVGGYGGGLDTRPERGTRHAIRISRRGIGRVRELQRPVYVCRTPLPTTH